MSARQIIDLRERLGINQTELAAKVGVSTDAVRKWERGDASPGGPAQILLHQLAELAPNGKRRKVAAAAR